MKIYKIAQITPNDFDALYEHILEEKGMSFDMHPTDWEIQGNRYYVQGISTDLMSIWEYDEDDYVPIIFGKEYQRCTSIEEASNLIKDILESGYDDSYGPYKEATMEEVFQERIENTPRTEFWPFVGYVLPNGEGMDFSDGGGHREDHRTIFDGSNKGMQEFMLRGAIRINCDKSMKSCGLNIFVEPTASQYNTLAKIGRDVSRMQGQIYLDLADDFEYDERDEIYRGAENYNVATTPSSFISEIKSFYS